MFFFFIFFLDLKMSTRCLDLITEPIYVRNFTCRLILLITISFQVYIFYFTCVFSYTKKSVLEYKMCLSNIFYCIVSTNRSLYSVMYNMEIFCTRPYCIENPYWTRRLRISSNMGFQYNTDSYNVFPYCT